MKSMVAVAFAIFLASVFTIALHAQTSAGPMSDAGYKAFLSQVDAVLPRLQTALKNIKPESDPRVSYAAGRMIVQERDLALLEIGNIRDYVARQRVKRTVYGEVALFNFIQSLYDSLSAETGAEAISNVTLSHLEKFAPEVGTLAGRIGNDSMVRVALLEKSTCP
ncbi:MAG: hypothetical protein WBW84_05070 [Acidobacteriaceae bacterium]